MTYIGDVACKLGSARVFFEKKNFSFLFPITSRATCAAHLLSHVGKLKAVDLTQLKYKLGSCGDARLAEYIAV